MNEIHNTLSSHLNLKNTLHLKNLNAVELSATSKTSSFASTAASITHNMHQILSLKVKLGFLTLYFRFFCIDCFSPPTNLG